MEKQRTVSRREFLKAAAAGAAMSAFGGCAGAESLPAAGARSRRQPNIIYILADDLGYGDLSCYGQKKFSTPNIDRLAKEGMLFTQHYAGSTVCAPSRCVLMTGLHTGHCQIRGNKGMQPEGQHPMKQNTVTAARLLEQCGYVTGAFGKWGLGGPGSSGEPNNQGFDIFFGYNCQSLAHHYYPTYLWRNREKVVLEGNDPAAQTGQYAPDLIVEEMLGFVRTHAGKPFFMFVPITIPHAELAVPEDSLVKYKGKFAEDKPYVNTSGRGYGSQSHPRAAFAAMVERMDGYVGKLLALLKELNIDDRTIVMFSSDNGPHLEGGADPDFFDSNGPLKGYKRDLYEGGIRVPMLVRWPGKIKAGSKSEHISAFWDILPTFAELAGAAVPIGIDGISFVPTLLGYRDNQTQHAQLYWEFHEQGGKQAVRMGKWKAVRLNAMQSPDGPVELYDLSKDIGEKNNVAARNPEVAAQLAARMEICRLPNQDFPFFSNEQ
jgi:arylsulfatase A-like enzyme